MGSLQKHERAQTTMERFHNSKQRRPSHRQGIFHGKQKLESDDGDSINRPGSPGRRTGNPALPKRGTSPGAGVNRSQIVTPGQGARLGSTQAQAGQTGRRRGSILMTPAAARGPDAAGRRIAMKPTLRMHHTQGSVDARTRNGSTFSTTVTGGNSRALRGLSTGDASFNALASRLTADSGRAGGAMGMGRAGEEVKRALLNKVMPVVQAAGQTGADKRQLGAGDDYTDRRLLTKKRADERRKP